MWLLSDSHQIKLGGRLCVPGLAHPTCNCLCIPLWLRCLVLCQTRASGGSGEKNIPFNYQLACTTGRSCVLVFCSLPRLPSVATPHCQISLPGLVLLERHCFCLLESFLILNPAPSGLVQMEKRKSGDQAAGILLWS